MNISKDNHEYSKSQKWNKYPNEYPIHQEMRIEYLKNIQYLNEYSIKYLFKYSTPFKMA